MVVLHISIGTPLSSPISPLAPEHKVMPSIISLESTFYIMFSYLELVGQSPISKCPGLIFNLMFFFVYLCVNVHFKTKDNFGKIVSSL
jgi:hypothetical protein